MIYYNADVTLAWRRKYYMKNKKSKWIMFWMVTDLLLLANIAIILWKVFVWCEFIAAAVLQTICYCFWFCNVIGRLENDQNNWFGLHNLFTFLFSRFVSTFFLGKPFSLWRQFQDCCWCNFWNFNKWQKSELQPLMKFISLRWTMWNWATLRLIELLKHKFRRKIAKLQ